MSTRRITYTGLFAALGILIPQFFHMIGGPGLGSILLPMHLPVLIGAMLLGPLSGMLIAMISVVVGAMMGMPPMPMAIFMFFELSTYGLVAGYLYKNRKVPMMVSLVAAMIAGRVASLAVVQIFLNVFGAQLPPVFGTLGMFAAGVPGMVLQLVLVPSVLLVLQRAHISMEDAYE